jgi:phosphopantothenate synthetase
MLMNSVTEEIINLKEPLIVVPLFYIKNYHVEKVLENGTQKVVSKLFEMPKTAHHVPNTSYSIDPEDPHGHRIYEAHNYFLLLPDGTTAQIVLKKTKAKIARKWNTLIKQKSDKPIFRFKYAISSFKEENNGHDYFNFHVTDFAENTPEEYNYAGRLAQTLVPIAEAALDQSAND